MSPEDDLAGLQRTFMIDQIRAYKADYVARHGYEAWISWLAEKCGQRIADREREGKPLWNREEEQS